MEIRSPLKWVGSKSRVMEKIFRHIPNDFDYYYEPFLGSGSMFLYLLQRVECSGWYLSDINSHLICWWRALQADVRELVRELMVLQEIYLDGDCKANYYRLRKEFNEYIPLDTHKAAMFMFMCQKSFNGLVRYNSRGEFNAAWGNQTGGRHRNNFVVDGDLLFKLNELLQGDIFFSCCTYSDIDFRDDSFIFLDPPYDPLGDRQIDKQAYHEGGFCQADFKEWCLRQGQYVMICNHDTLQTRQYFSKFNFLSYELVKSFAGAGNSRKKTSEVLITNY